MSNEQPSDPQPEWYSILPSWAKVFMQLGFAALIALLFTLDSRERSRQLQTFQEDARIQSREERMMFREESKANREELKSLREDMRQAVNEMKRAIDKLNENHVLLKAQIDHFKTKPDREDKQ